jgi:hypothetical protein
MLITGLCGQLLIILNLVLELYWNDFNFSKEG